MGNLAIQVEGLGKQYKIGGKPEAYKTLREVIVSGFSTPLRRARNLFRGEAYGAADLTESFWALENVYFSVNHGDAVGIIGRNGAGKSTLLKVLSRITEPTTGVVDLYGRVGALLEVGTGFHPELTGRENVYLNGAILGMSRHEIGLKFDEIVDFSGVEKFIDTPVKHYSSGMRLRLGFAIAAHLEPEILVIDEVLAVGDAQFQKKCLRKMSDVASEGRTVLFVSHNMAAVKTLCSSAILLNEGQIVTQGEVSTVVNQYLQSGENSRSEYTWNSQAPGNEKACLRKARIVEARKSEWISLDQPITIEIDYEVFEADAVLNLSLSVFNQESVYVLASPSLTDTRWSLKPHPPGLYRGRCVIPGNLLNTGRYDFTILPVENGRYVIAQADRIISVDMVDLGQNRGAYLGRWNGAVSPVLDWNIDNL